MQKYTFLLILSIVLTGCFDKKLSSENIKQSSQEIENSLPEGKKIAFRGAFILISTSDFDKYLDDKYSARIKKLDGKTGDEIIAEGKKLKKRIAGKINELIKDMDWLNSYARKKKAENPLIINNASYFHKKSEYYSKGENCLNISVTNKSSHAISMIQFDVKLMSKDRSIPWVEDSLSHNITGGIEPGETHPWVICPDRFGKWGNAPRARLDNYLNVDITKSYGAGLEEPIFDITGIKSTEELINKFKSELSVLDAYVKDN